MTYIRQLRAIASITFTESIRQPVYLVLVLLGMGLLALAPAVSAFTLEDDNKLLIDIGLSTIFLAGLFLAAFTASGVVAEEIEKKTALTVVTKPISRPLFILGKFFGIYGAILVAHWIWSLVFLLGVRHRVVETNGDSLHLPVIIFGMGGILLSIGVALRSNYFRGRVFSSVLAGSLAVILPAATLLAFLFDREWGLQSPLRELDPQILLALLLVLEAQGILCAVAVAAATRFGLMATLSVSSMIFLLGLTSEYLFGRSSGENLCASLGYTVAPNFQFFWIADALTQNNPVSLGYAGLVSAHAFLYITAVLSLAVILFQTRELG